MSKIDESQVQIIKGLRVYIDETMTVPPEFDEEEMDAISEGDPRQELADRGQSMQEMTIVIPRYVLNSLPPGVTIEDLVTMFGAP